MPGSVSASAPYESYIYNYWEETVAVPAAYVPVRSVTGRIWASGSFGAQRYACVRGGNIYVLDSGNKRIVCLDEAWNVVRVIDAFMNEGKEDGFANPSGIFIDGDENIYVADTDHQRVVVLTAEGALVRIIEQPESDVRLKAFNSSR